MNILVLNGSPKGQRSNTLKLTKSFLKGLCEQQNNNVNIVDIASSKIDHCLGCYQCWTKTPGECIIKDDMQHLTQEYVNADLVIWSFPLYYFGIPSKTKAFLDRLLPTNLPFMEKLEQNNNIYPSHLSRYDLSKQKYILISTCGFYTTKNNYEALFKQFDILYIKNLTKIVCPEGELFRVEQLSSRTDEYLEHMKNAGLEYSKDAKISSNTMDNLNELLYNPDSFIEMANASWEIATPKEATNQQKDISSTSTRFMKQMAATYNKEKYSKDIVLEMHFTDIQKRYQLLINQTKCTLKTDEFLPYTTKIETPFSVWERISKGELSGEKAMMDKLYRVSGDFNTMLAMGELFGTSRAKVQEPLSNKKSNMIVLLLPFLALWCLMSSSPKLAGIFGILASGLVGILHFKWKKVPYESIGSFLVICISLFALLTNRSFLLVSAPSFAFGTLWLSSIFTKVPITAYYSCNSYGGEKAFTNPLFIRTNRILTCVWAVSNILLSLIAAYMYFSTLAPYWGIISNVPTILLGIFTSWFSKWYPAYYAKSK